MGKQKKVTRYLDPWDITVEVPLAQLAHLEVSLLKLLQTFHEAGVNAVYQQILRLDPDEDPQKAIEDAIDLYNQLVEEQREELEGFLSEEEEDSEEEIEEEFEEESAAGELPLFGRDKDSSSQTLH